MHDKNVNNLNDEILTLQRLGLTRNEAKVLHTLFSLEPSSVKIVSNLSKIPRSKVYRIMSQLEQKGLVASVISRPIKFSAIPLEDCVRIMLEKKDIEHKSLARSAKGLLKTVQKQTIRYDDMSEFTMVPTNEYNITFRKIILNNLRKSIDIITTWKRYNEILESQSVELNNAIVRGVNFRWIMDKPSRKSNSFSYGDASIEKQFEMRYLLDRPEALFAVSDKEKVTFILKPEETLKNSPLLWSNNKHLITIFQGYFDFLWLTSIADLEDLTKIQSGKKKK